MNEHVSIGIDIGGTKIVAGLVTLGGGVLYKQTVPTATEGREQILFQLQQLIKDCVKEAHQQRLPTLKGIGIGTAGQIDFKQGIVRSGTSNIKDWNDIPLKQEMQRLTGFPTWVDNDVNVVALAESHLGAAKGYDNVVFLTLGTGIGGAVIQEGRLLHGEWGGAAELGHMSVDRNGPACNCGYKGCLEAYASGTGIANRMKHMLKNQPERYDGDIENITARDVFQWAAEGKPFAKSILDEAMDALAYGTVNIIHAFNPSLIVLGGGIIDQHNWIISDLENRVRSLGISSLVQSVSFKKAAFGDEAGVVGAAYQSFLYNEFVQKEGAPHET
ncbi:ROK family protein [Fictibacillus phosphorivorans]|uniref:ROK family protein n=1 Tax=Fictibacillus phosphorivorans TaxID=1221500 RepID=UPI002040DEC4|nr:ROK family protein [Fictibacillus phosphorivorans]MCM3718543.1 ROK family protein [Fictibacillus phosphorivorans]MCM3776101.1 ROK family protein [Fictibacillus phosphorivorans]